MVVDTSINILTDSVCDIQAKLFYQATGGKTIVNAWEAPMPASLQVLTHDQAVEWGNESMTWRAARIGTDSRRRGTRKVSAMKNFAQRSTANPFHGYRSEPPKAKAFKFVDPIGPVATAIKAAGELAAVAEFKGEDDKPVWDLLKGSWGVKISELKKYVKPDLSGTSEKDIIKFVRSPSHMLYGFNNHAPAVTTTLGKFRPETMPDNYMFDWHSFSLALRYQGEYVARYQGGFPSVKAAGAFAPAYAEGEAFRRTVTTENMVSGPAVEQSVAIGKIVETTMKHYIGEMNSYGVRSKGRFATARANVSSDLNIDVSVINALASRKSKANMHLAKGMKDVVADRVAYDIKEQSGGKFHNSVAKSAIKFGSHYVPTWISVHALLWEQFFRSGGENAQRIIAILRSESTFLALEQSAQDDLKFEFLRNVPKDFGYTLHTVLSIRSPDIEHATLEFLKMASTFTEDEQVVPNQSWSDIYYSSVANSASFKKVLGYVRMGFLRQQSLVHSAGNIIVPNTPGMSIAENFTTGISNFSKERLSYWSEHYYSRVEEYRATLKRLGHEGKKRGIRWSKVGSTYPKMKSMQVDISEMTDEHIVDYHKGCRYGVVAYAFLARCYQASTVAVDDRFNVKVGIRPGSYAKIMASIARKYANKRSSRRADGTMYDINDVCSKLDEFTRHTDMNIHLDRAIVPAVSWVSLYNIYLEKANVTAESVTKTLKARISNCIDDVKNVVEEVKMDMAIAVEDAQPGMKLKDDNPYAMLYGSDSDSSSIGSSAKTSRDVKSNYVVVDAAGTVESEEHNRVFTTKDVADHVLDSDEIDSADYCNTNVDVHDSFANMFGDDELFEEDDVEDVDYTRVSLRNFIINSQTAVYDHATFNEFLLTEYGAADDTFMSVAELDSATKAYNMCYNSNFADPNAGSEESEGNVDIV